MMDLKVCDIAKTIVSFDLSIYQIDVLRFGSENVTFRIYEYVPFDLHWNGYKDLIAKLQGSPCSYEYVFCIFLCTFNCICNHICFVFQLYLHFQVWPENFNQLSSSNSYDSGRL